MTRLGYHRIIGVKRKGSIRGRSGGRPSQVAPCTPTVGAPTGQLLQLQRTVGNRAVARAITSASTVHWPPSGAGVEPRHVPPPTAKFRLPSFAELEKSYKSATLAIPESVIKNRVGVLLGRLAREKKLTSKDPVKDIVARIFPGGGKIDKAAFEAAVDVADRALIYGTVLDAEIKVKAADKAKLVKAFDESAKLADKVKSDKKGLKQVFGSKHADAKANYGKAASALRDTARNLDARVTTDYNLDDPQVGLGGWADFGSRHMHLTLDVAKVADKASTKITLVHEGAHLAESSIDDQGYYGTASFEALDEDIKIANAAHYEELPRRVLGKSKFAGVDFKPGLLKGGAAPTYEDNVRRSAGQTTRKAWDRAVDLYGFLRDVRKEVLAGNPADFVANKSDILMISKKMGLTIHVQAAGKQEVTQLDITLAEGVARGMSLVGRLIRRQKVPVLDPWLQWLAPGMVVNEALVDYGNLLGDATKDLELVNWLAAGYRTSIP